MDLDLIKIQFWPSRDPSLAGGGRVEEDEREKRKTAGELVGQRWRHSDQSSRVEQLMKSFPGRIRSDRLMTALKSVIPLGNDLTAAEIL